MPGQKVAQYCACGEENSPSTVRCIKCGNDISDLVPSASSRAVVNFILRSIDGEYSFEIMKDNLVIGRDQGMSEYLCNKPFVSRKHAKLSIDGESLVIENLSNTNSTYVNNKRMTVGERVTLSDGDELGFGGFTKDDQRQSEAAYFLVMIGDYASYIDSSEKIVLSENVNTFHNARDLLINHYQYRAIFRDDIHELITLLDSYTRSSEIASEIIKKVFPTPQMAHDKFMVELANSDTAFLRLMCKSADIIGITSRRSEKRDEMLRKVKDDARTLIELCDDLATVLIGKYENSSNRDESTKEIDVLLADLQSLIESVKNYS